MPVLQPIAALALRRGVGPLVRTLLSRPFAGNGMRRILILYEPNRISWAQVYPIVARAPALAARHRVQLRLHDATDPGAPLPATLDTAETVLLQTWLTDPEEKLQRHLDRIRALPARPAYAYLDSFANEDIRFARHMPDARLYMKKGLLRDPSGYYGPRAGHTLPEAYYVGLYGLPARETDWQVPAGYHARLRAGPNFLADPQLDALFRAEAPPETARPLDMQARFATEGPQWYAAMRREALRAAQASGAATLETAPTLPRRRFLAELRASKLCFSPFGYGEICWRDIEAIACGAVLVKPDMSHLVTRPDLYEDGVTYVACRWDYADLAEKVQALLADPDRRERIARAAYARARAYLQGEILDDLAPLFDLTRAP